MLVYCTELKSVLLSKHITTLETHTLSNLTADSNNSLKKSSHIDELRSFNHSLGGASFLLFDIAIENPIH